jgi:hypothetical protein
LSHEILSEGPWEPIEEASPSLGLSDLIFFIFPIGYVFHPCLIREAIVQERDVRSTGRPPIVTAVPEGSRFRRAMAAEPFARSFELAPIRLYLLPATRRHLLDLFAGGGFISRFFGRQFSRVTLIDRIAPSPGGRDDRWTTLSGSAADPDVLRRVAAPADLIACVAGFHHLIAASAGRLDPVQTRALRTRVLGIWRRMLAPGGRLIVVDVPATGCPCGTFAGARIGANAPHARHLDGAFEEAAGRTLASLGPPDTAWPSALEGYLEDLRRRLDRHAWTEPEPARFFDAVVARENPAGHEAHFQATDDQVGCFREAGFAEVGAAVFPTPWAFRDRASALWFVRELLSLGRDPVAGPSLLSDRQADTVESWIDRYLGHRLLADGTHLVQRKLMAVWGERL